MKANGKKLAKAQLKSLKGGGLRCADADEDCSTKPCCRGRICVVRLGQHLCKWEY